MIGHFANSAQTWRKHTVKNGFALGGKHYSQYKINDKNKIYLADNALAELNTKCD